MKNTNNLIGFSLTILGLLLMVVKRKTKKQSLFYQLQV